MYLRYALIGLLAIVFTASMAFADGGFHGTVSYRDCECHSGSWDNVRIVNDATGAEHIARIHLTYPTSGTYGTQHTTFPEGYYSISVVLGDGSDCDHSYVQKVYHSDDPNDQTVDLVVFGPTSQPH